MKTEFDLYIAPDGTEFNLNDWNGTWLLGGDGYGMPPIKYHTSHGPFQHGETPIDFFLQPRVIQFQFRAQACTREKYYTLRNSVLDMLRPSRQNLNTFVPGTLRKVLADGRTRDISVFVDSGPTYAWSNENWDEWGSINTLRFIAFDPTFFDPTSASASFTFTPITNLVFPITFPIAFGTTVINNTVSITYTGTWMVYPTIVLVGPLAGITITNETIDEMIRFNYSIPAGRTVTMDLAYGAKTVEDDLGNNLIGSISSDSDLATFHIAPDPEAPGGVNVIRALGAGTLAGATQITLEYYTRYIGI